MNDNSQSQKTFDDSKLIEADSTSQDWALAWFRVITRDKPTNGVYPIYSLTDSEIIGYLNITASYLGSEKHYLPFEAVAVKIETDPTYALSISWEGFSETRRNPLEIAQSLRKTYRNLLGKCYPVGLLTSQSLMLDAGF